MIAENLSASQQEILDAQITRIKEEILASGESIADCDKLLLLCSRVAISGQWSEIAKIAIAQQWSFTFFPNGDVRFANL
ncbi:MAG: hypothetical protein M3N12_09460 [Verrucomicrobiota bacterium]|nr:hypothetical protein [Verrucomicrobiota bacterium]